MGETELYAEYNKILQKNLLINSPNKTGRKTLEAVIASSLPL